MGVLKYIPTNAYPFEATDLAGRMQLWFGPGLSLNQVPKQDVLVRERVVPAERRVVPRGPVYVLKGGDIGVVSPGGKDNA